MLGSLGQYGREMEIRDWIAGVSLAISLVSLAVALWTRREAQRLKFVERKHDAMRKIRASIRAQKDARFILVGMARLSDRAQEGDADVRGGLQQMLRANFDAARDVIEELEGLYRRLEKIEAVNASFETRLDLEELYRGCEELLERSEHVLEHLEELMNEAERRFPGKLG